MEYIKNNLDEVEERIQAACKRAGRDRSEVQLIAVSKTVEADVMNASIDFGVTDLGENRVQEIRRKYDDVKAAKWHLIGHLQTNKVKYIIDKVDLIHSVDSYRLAEEISKRAEKHDKIMSILLQVDMANEAQKFGVDSDEVKSLLDEILKLEHVKVEGLMFIAPFVSDPEEVRDYFKSMKNLFDELKANRHERLELKHLSMGMTNDFEVAIEEGATLLRVGTGVYGKRTYK
ncbi:YggS family pyridoxal phosphate-dependent enzyme [Acidaminobacter sp. JC074]|uniref:YggS family pyridoxal phosphate-dependent enzyme n=1 Tax=Acidaminobacter sp. JC074 TaxID=2530199 RepID=UPI001F0E3510|nr:YggS family pyridoxal phosphate-dependent enzyme [Acidaminobacter sp. JC074]MCH4890232.1 YggS family pyridoxal phosphate-dependent enzyme [Acidaminobacter sp. JC074]